MLYPIKPPIPSDYLDGLRDLQIKLIELCFDEEDVNPETLHNSLPPEIANFLCNNFKKLIGTLKRAIRTIPISSKEEIIRIFKHDYSFSEHITDDAFQFLELDDECVSKLKKWCIIIFKQFTSRIDDCITKNGYINKKEWIKKYKQNNPFLDICPFCDCQYHKEVTIEHYLPKSIYPFLAVHPMNLIPCCTKCNGEKGDDNILINARIGQTPFPYSFDFKIADICFDCDQQSFYFIQCGEDDKCFQEFIRVMDVGYKLPARWNEPKFLDQMQERAFKKISEYSALLKYKEVYPQENPNQFINEIIDFFKSQFGKNDQLRLIYVWLSAMSRINPDFIMKGARLK